MLGSGAVCCARSPPRRSCVSVIAIIACMAATDDPTPFDAWIETQIQPASLHVEARALDRDFTVNETVRLEGAMDACLGRHDPSRAWVMDVFRSNDCMEWSISCRRPWLQSIKPHATAILVTILKAIGRPHVRHEANLDQECGSAADAVVEGHIEPASLSVFAIATHGTFAGEEMGRLDEAVQRAIESLATDDRVDLTSSPNGQGAMWSVSGPLEALEAAERKVTRALTTALIAQGRPLVGRGGSASQATAPPP